MSLYSCVISCQGIRDRDSFVGNIVDAIDETMKAAEMQRAYDRLVAPPNGGVTFAKPLHRSVAVAMSDHVYAAKLYLSDGLAAPQIGFRLNHSRHPGLIDRQGRSSAKPWEVFAGLVDESDPSAPCSARSQ
nr:hypothetical protein [Novipirellula galeiformis]